jgi:hypothetical protein
MMVPCYRMHDSNTFDLKITLFSRSVGIVFPFGRLDPHASSRLLQVKMPTQAKRLSKAVLIYLRAYNTGM